MKERPPRYGYALTSGREETPVDRDFKQNLKTERIVILTEEALIEGTLLHHQELRLSDALNAPQFRDHPYLSLTDAVVTRISSPETVLQSKFLLVSRSRILCITPKSEVLHSGIPSLPTTTAPSVSPPSIGGRYRGGGIPEPSPTAPVKGEAFHERRATPRRRGSLLPVLISNGNTKSAPFEGWVLDRSAEGIRLLVKNAVAEGSRLAVRPLKAPSGFPWLSIEVRNCSSDKGKVHLGCRFLEKPTIEELQQFG
jgi:hypothetical protein